MKNPFTSRKAPRGPVFARTAVPRDADPVEKGYAFEQFIVSMFDHKKYFTLLEWRSDKKWGGIYPLSSRHPDLEIEFECKEIKQSFAVECKYQQYLPYSGFAWANEKQFANYQHFASIKNIPVFIAFGYGGHAGSPTQLYIVPLEKMNSIYINEDFLSPFQHHNIETKLFFDAKDNSLR